LAIEIVPALCHCSACHHDFQPSDWIYECPRCRQICTEILQGRDLELLSLEVS
jgi:hydrogenase nickel incorporation protein HypA/HybF